jgi:hypothetical protein
MVITYLLILKDQSVLEQYHISHSFKLLQEEKFNIFANFKDENYRKIRSHIISMVLATDMA